MSIYLKIKNKHLALEAGVIKFEERKQKKLGNYQVVNSLCEHRKRNVRNENRATSLARAYIRGADYSTVESKRKPEREYDFETYVYPRVLMMIQKYKDRKFTKQELDVWLKT